MHSTLTFFAYCLSPKDWIIHLEIEKLQAAALYTVPLTFVSRFLAWPQVNHFFSFSHVNVRSPKLNTWVCSFIAPKYVELVTWVNWYGQIIVHSRKNSNEAVMHKSSTAKGEELRKGPHLFICPFMHLSNHHSIKENLTKCQSLKNSLRFKDCYVSSPWRVYMS